MSSIRSKALLEQALAIIEPYQNPYTPFLHTPATSGPTPHSLIPVKENFFYALCLIMTHLQQKVLEGKAHLMRLLAFQIKEVGAFPNYLHTFPHQGSDDYQADILFALHWIESHYLHLFKAEELKVFKEATQALYDYLSKRQVKEGSLFSLKRQCLDKARGNNPVFYEGEYDKELTYSSSLADLFLYSRLEVPALKPLLSLSHSLWDEELKVFIGPLTRASYWGCAPQPSLLDVYKTQQIPHHLPLDAALKACLLPSFQEVDSPLTFSISKIGESFNI